MVKCLPSAPADHMIVVMTQLQSVTGPIKDAKLEAKKAMLAHFKAKLDHVALFIHKAPTPIQVKVFRAVPGLASCC